jgi:hypothetical protein
MKCPCIDEHRVGTATMEKVIERPVDSRAELSFVVSQVAIFEDSSSHSDRDDGVGVLCRKRRIAKTRRYGSL